MHTFFLFIPLQTNDSFFFHKRVYKLYTAASHSFLFIFCQDPGQGVAMTVFWSLRCQREFNIEPSLWNTYKPLAASDHSACRRHHFVLEAYIMYLVGATSKAQNA